MQDKTIAREGAPVKPGIDDARSVDDALIQEITRRIVEEVHPNRIILFGSRARDNARPDSDIDLFVELDTTESRLERYMRVNQLFYGRHWSMDLIVMTPKEVRERRTVRHSIIPTIEREGKILFDRSLAISNA